MTDIYTRKRIQDTVEGLGYKYFTNDNYDVNIIGIRNSNTGNKVSIPKVALAALVKVIVFNTEIVELPISFVIVIAAVVVGISIYVLLIIILSERVSFVH